MFDKYNRCINTIRISVTDRCNLKCFYCYEECEYFDKKDILSFEKITEIVREASLLGIINVKLTGGEPLLRKDIDILIKMIREIKQIQDISITTNGILLEEIALKLKNAGLNRINVSLDTLDKDKYAKITRGGNIENVFKGIFFAKTLNFDSIKINTVLLKGVNDSEIEDIKEFAYKNNFGFQLINQMNLKKEKNLSENGVTNKPTDCWLCNRIRLTANGFLLPCLFSEKYIDIKNYSNYKDALIDCINAKPENGEKNKKFSMMQIGG